MNLLADENVDGAMIRRLRVEGHDVLSIRETSPSIADEEVLRLAVESNRVIITTDKDFGELIYRLRKAHGGVVLLRLAGLSSEDRADLLAEVVRDHAAELPGSFTVVEPSSVRIRRMPGDSSSASGETP